MTNDFLPRWDMTPYFPGLDSAEFAQALSDWILELDQAEQWLTSEGLDHSTPGGLTPEQVRQFESAVAWYNKLSDDGELLSAYVYSFVSTDSTNDLAGEKESNLDDQLSRFRKWVKRVNKWIGGLGAESLEQLSAVARDHKYAVQRAKVEASHQLSAGEEDLISDLELTGSVAWSRLRSNLTSQLQASVDLGKGPELLPISAIRALAYDPDAGVREKAYQAEIAAWPKVEVAVAEAMNGVKGEIGLLARRRGWESPLSEAIFNSNIDETTLSAMLDSARAAFPHFRRYLQAKAKFLGKAQLPWYDLFAPVGKEAKSWSYDEAIEFVAEQFGTYSPKMREFALKSHRENWTDVSPRPGKTDGAFCMRTRGDESRILMNFKPSFGSVSTLAHELGHGYHNLCLSPRTALQRVTPSTLAETASIFCETIIRQAAQSQGSSDERLAVLEASLQGSTQVVVDITSRFDFESAVFAARQSKTLRPKEYCELMLTAQRGTYGDGLDQSVLHPYMWLAKPHYYGGSFYNFPYMFGLLFALGLYAVYQKDPEAFRSRYDDLLSSTGLADAATLAANFGIDIRKSSFWEGSLTTIQADVDQFEALVKA